MRKAYRCTIKGWSIQIIYPGETRGKAKYQAWLDGYTAGYTDLLYVDVHAIRAPEFDVVAEKAPLSRVPECLGWIDEGESWGCLAKGGTSE